MRLIATQDKPGPAFRFGSGKFGKERPRDKEGGAKGPGIGTGNKALSYSGSPLPHGLKQAGANGWLITEEEEGCLHVNLVDDGFKSLPDGTPHSPFEVGVPDAPNRLILQQGLHFTGVCPGHHPDRIRPGLDGRIHGMKDKGPAVPGD